jgi:hypothetical protein
MPDLHVAAGQRLACVGRTDSGKSVLARAVFKSESGRKVVVDPFDSELTEGVGEQDTVSETTQIDWARFDTWRVVPSREHLGDWDWYSHLYEFLFDSAPILIWTDEASRVTTSQRIPMGVDLVQSQGRKRKVTHIICATRPARVHGSLWSQSDHWAVFRLRWQADKDAVAAAMGQSANEFQADQDRLSHHGFIWYDTKGDRKIIVPNGLPLATVRQVEAKVPRPVETIDAAPRPVGGK